MSQLFLWPKGLPIFGTYLAISLIEVNSLTSSNLICPRAGDEGSFFKGPQSDTRAFSQKNLFGKLITADRDSSDHPSQSRYLAMHLLLTRLLVLDGAIRACRQKAWEAAP